MSCDYGSWCPGYTVTARYRWRREGGARGAHEFEDLRWHRGRLIPCVTVAAPPPALESTRSPPYLDDTNQFMARKESTELVDGKWWFVLRDQRQERMHDMLARHFRARAVPHHTLPYLFGTTLWEMHGRCAPARAQQLRQLLKRTQSYAQLEMTQWAISHGLTVGTALERGLIYVIYDEHPAPRMELEVLGRHDDAWRPHQRPPPENGTVAVHLWSGHRRSRACVWMRWSQHWSDFHVEARGRRGPRDRDLYLQQCLFGQQTHRLAARRRGDIARAVAALGPREREGLLDHRLCVMLRDAESGASVRIARAGDAARATIKFVETCRRHSPRATALLEDLQMVLVGPEGSDGKIPHRECRCAVRGMEMVVRNHLGAVISNEYASSSRCPHRHLQLVSLYDIMSA